MVFDTRVSGIPCLCKVLDYSAYMPMRVIGSGFGDAVAPSPEEFDYRILDRKGYAAPWLDRKLTKEDEERLLNEYQLEIGAGLGALAGKVWRIGLMGYASNQKNVLFCLGALEAVLNDMGANVGTGAVSAAMQVYASK